MQEPHSSKPALLAGSARTVGEPNKTNQGRYMNVAAGGRAYPYGDVGCGVDICMCVLGACIYTCSKLNQNKASVCHVHLPSYSRLSL